MLIQDVGRLLLLTEPIVFNGVTLKISEENATKAPAKPGANAPFVPRTAGSRPRAGLGSKKAGLGAVAGGSSAAAPVAQGTASSAPATRKNQDDFRNMLLSGKK